MCCFLQYTKCYYSYTHTSYHRLSIQSSKHPNKLGINLLILRKCPNSHCPTNPEIANSHEHVINRKIWIIYNVLIQRKIDKSQNYTLKPCNPNIVLINIHTLNKCLNSPSKSQRTRISTVNPKLYSILTTTLYFYNHSNIASPSLLTAQKTYHYKGMLNIITNANPNLLSRHHNTSRNNHNSHPDFCSTVTNTPQTSARYILLSISQPYRPRQQSAPYWLQVTIMSQNQLATSLTGKLINLKLIFSGWELTHRLTNNCIHSLYELQQNSATNP